MTAANETGSLRAASRAKKMNALLRNYLYWSTLLGVFSAILVVRIPFAIRMFDVLMLINLPLMFLLVNFARVPAWVPCLVLYLAMSGSIGIANGTDSLALVAKELIGITVCLLYFVYFFKLIRNDFERAFRTYAKIAYWFAVIAFPLWAFACIQSNAFERLRGLTPEPAAFCVLILPAYYWYVYLHFTSRKHAAEIAVFTLAIVLSASSLGYLSVAFGAILLLSGRKRNLLAIPVVVCGVLGLAYISSSFFRVRVDDTLLAATTEDVGSANLSTYALLSNVFVTQQVFNESPLIGNGLGSHPLSHERFISDIPGVGPWLASGLATINAPDAASFGLRSLSELGILGFLGTLCFLFYFHVSGTGIHAAISNAILVCFFLKFIRIGLYFPPEQFFFVFVYMLNHRQFKHEARAAARHVPYELAEASSSRMRSGGADEIAHFGPPAATL